MSADFFLDTNILIYAVVQPDARSKTAQDLVGRRCRISVQVLNEFANVARRRFRRSWQEIASALADIRRVCREPLVIGVAEHEHALLIAQRDGLAFYDALIVASALKAGCSTLLTEDMQDGRVIEGRLTIRNPFPVVRGM